MTTFAFLHTVQLGRALPASGYVQSVCCEQLTQNPCGSNSVALRCATLRGFRAYEFLVSDSTRTLHTGTALIRACCGEWRYDEGGDAVCQSTQTVRPTSSEPVDDQRYEGGRHWLRHARFRGSRQVNAGDSRHWSRPPERTCGTL